MKSISHYPHLRWYMVILALMCGYLLCNQLYEARLSASGWLDRMVEAIQDARYPDAERCFQRARRLAPRAEIVDVAFHVLYWHLSHDNPMAATRFYFLGGLDVLLGWTPAKERAWRAQNEIRAADWLQQAAWPSHSYRTLGVAATLFDQYGRVHPREVEALLTALLAFRRRQYQPMYDCCSQLEQRQPALFQSFRTAAPFLLHDYAVAAGNCGHPADAHRLQALYRAQPPFWYNTYDDYQPRSIRQADPAQEASAWVAGAST